MRPASINQISIIIPVGPNELSFFKLLSDLSSFNEAEVIFVGTKPPGVAESSKIPIQWLISREGRAAQMNFGAKSSSRAFLWFLHADSRLSNDAIEKLLGSLLINPSALHYFDLAFLPDGPKLTRINEFGTHIRSQCFGMPFGDQGLCLRRDLFEKIGGFPESVPYGEDHLFVWRARQYGIPLRNTGTRLYTSARKYKNKGWLKTTLSHLYLTYRQALPEWYELQRKRFRSHE